MWEEDWDERRRRRRRRRREGGRKKQRKEKIKRMNYGGMGTKRYSSESEKVKDGSAVFPHIRISVFLLTLIIETIYL